MATASGQLLLPVPVATAPAFDPTREEHLESFGTSNFTLPRFLLLPELLRQHGTVLMQDMDLIHRRTLLGTGTTFVKSGWQYYPHMMADPWGRRGDARLGQHLPIFGRTGSADCGRYT